MKNCLLRLVGKMLPIACLAMLLTLIFVSGTVQAEMHELVVQVDQTLTINVPDRLSFTVSEIDDQWHDILGFDDRAVLLLCA